MEKGKISNLFSSIYFPRNIFYFIWKNIIYLYTIVLYK